ncbi:MAG TPA: 3-dehydroquinate synthase [Thermomicrobiales bacterium]|nr:3-dehydroquinate synthase [Thermomicrobiales bacterium]
MGLLTGYRGETGHLMVTRVVLTGFSGTGKSTVGRLLAERLGWRLIDMDAEIERQVGVTIPDFFEAQGEAAFRAHERRVFLEALGQDAVVISTGGGAVCNDDIWSTLHSDPGAFVVRFDAAPEELVRRLDVHRAQAPRGETTRRPMLDADDQLGRISSLLSQREPYYALADVTIPVEDRSPERITDDVAELVALANGMPSEIRIDVANASSRIVVGSGTRSLMVNLLGERWPGARNIWMATDAGMATHHTAWIERVGAGAQAVLDTHVVPSGEKSKSIAGLSDLYDWMIGGGVERGDVAVAAGGGVTGDLMGFAAATVLRGIGLVQVPTTLLSMVDSSVGGKTGINHPGGKNLIGAFYQPSLVVVDPAFLITLPGREMRSGFAEIIKHAAIQASTPGGEGDFLYRVLERNAARLLALEEPLTSWVIRQNISLKAAVVEADEKEARLRQILNFGHTIGHGIEAAGYSLLHGEAVAVGMIAAMAIAVEKGLVLAADRDRLVSLISAYGLPTSARVDPGDVRRKMAHDKKKSAGMQQWIMPLPEGGVEIRTDIGELEIAAALRLVTSV